MAIAKVKKIEIIGLQEDRDEILVLLQKLGIVELIETRETAPRVNSYTPNSQVNLSEVEDAILYLASFQKNPGLFEGMVKLRPLIYQRQLQEVMASFDYQGLLGKLSELRNQLKNLTQHKDHLLQEKCLLSAWRRLKIPLDQMHYTQSCGILLGFLATADYTDLLAHCDKEGIRLFCECLNQNKNNTYLVILYIKEELAQLEVILKNHHFNFVTLVRHGGTVEQRLLEIDREVLVFGSQISDTASEIAQLSQQQFKLMVVHDYLANIAYRQQIDKKLALQQFTFSLSGWIRVKDVNLLENKLLAKFPETAIFTSEPKRDEDIPTALENKLLIRPFEAVTNLYGQPLYSGLDPTLFLAPFFALSFGFCMLDAGYGLIIFITMLFFLRKKEISINGKKFLRLFLFAATATILAGLFTGNFFGDLLSRLPGQFNFFKNLQKRLIVFDPLKDSLIFLAVTLILGFVQIWTGVFIQFIRSLRADRFRALILDLPTLLVQTGLLMLALIFAKVLPKFMLQYVLMVLIACAVLVIYYQWKSNREISLKIFWAIFGIYSIITGNFLADTLSFSRIFALGLTGSLLAMAINTMLFPKGPVTGLLPAAGAAVTVLVLILGHIFNLAISFLGAYVHTSRLQYLEFFTKFFESGGRPFRPFKEETKYIVLAQQNNQEV